LRVPHRPVGQGRPPNTRLQQKKSQKGNWESLSVASKARGGGGRCYNKRNPKKGIESYSPPSIPRPTKYISQLQQKKSQKGNWEIFLTHTKRWQKQHQLQQKKSQKGNWEILLSLWR